LADRRSVYASVILNGLKERKKWWQIYTEKNKAVYLQCTEDRKAKEVKINFFPSLSH
jgi:hypothetical protein